MEHMIDITPLFAALAAFLAALLSPKLGRWLSAKTNAAERESALCWASIAVKAAEQLYRQNEGEKKKQYVQEFLSAHGCFLDFGEMENAIEAAVLELHSYLYGGGA